MDKELKLLKDRILKVKDKLTPLSILEMENVENKLGIKLSNEFKKLNLLHEYDYFTYFDFYNWDQEEGFSVIGETLIYRNALNLPKEWLVLAADDDMCVLMGTRDSPEMPSPVVWCSILEELEYLRETNIISNNIIRVFDTFTDFYEFLLEHAEKTKQEELKPNLSS